MRPSESDAVNNALILNTIGRSPSLYEAVSEQLLSAIREAGLTPGDKIPSERLLGERFGVSRTVVREAIRHLAAKGVLEVQSGSGVRVADVGHAGVSESIDLYLRQRGPVNAELVHEVRQCLEVRIVELAAMRASDDDLRVIRDTCESMADVLDDVHLSSQADIAFHRSIAGAVGNPLFLVLIDSIADVLLHAREATLKDSARGQVALDAHRAIVRALELRDPAASADAMTAHLTDSLVAFSKVQGQSS